MRESARRIIEFVEKEIKSGIKPERIVLAGFGQGGAVALSAALRCKHRLAGVVSLSSWLAEGKDHGDILVNPYHVGMPALVCHGNADGACNPCFPRHLCTCCLSDDPEPSTLNSKL